LEIALEKEGVCPCSVKLEMFEHIRGCKNRAWHGGPTGGSHYFMPCKRENYEGAYRECPCYRES